MRTVNYILLSSLLCVLLGVLLVSAQEQTPPGTAWHSFVSDADVSDPDPTDPNPPPPVTIWYFGGMTAFSANDKLWQFVPVNTTPWTKITPKSRENPKARHGHAATHDTTQDLHIIFGGASPEADIGFHDDTWFYNPATNRWSSSTGCPDGSGDGGGSTRGGGKGGGGKTGGGGKKGGGAGPAARFVAAMAYNPTTTESTLFGGEQPIQGQVFGDTWTLRIIDGKACWTNERRLNPAPEERIQAAMAYFPLNNGTIVLHGGRRKNGTMLCDMWEWDGTAWSEIVQTETDALCIRDHSLLFDQNLGQLCVFGGELNPVLDSESNNLIFCYDFATNMWSDHQPSPVSPARSGAPVAQDNETGDYVRFGGIGETDDFLSDTEIFTIN